MFQKFQRFNILPPYYPGHRCNVHSIFSPETTYDLCALMRGLSIGLYTFIFYPKIRKLNWQYMVFCVCAIKPNNLQAKIFKPFKPPGKLNLWSYIILKYFRIIFGKRYSSLNVVVSWVKLLSHPLQLRINTLEPEQALNIRMLALTNTFFVISVSNKYHKENAYTAVTRLDITYLGTTHKEVPSGYRNLTKKTTELKICSEST